MKIYCAGPFFTPNEREHLNQMIEFIKKKYPEAELYIPMEHFITNGDKLSNDDWANLVFNMDTDALLSCDMVIGLYMGHYSDTGTAWELGYACAYRMPTYIYIPLDCIDNDMSIMPIQACLIINDVDNKTLNQK